MYLPDKLKYFPFQEKAKTGLDKISTLKINYFNFHALFSKLSASLLLGRDLKNTVLFLFTTIASIF